MEPDANGDSVLKVFIKGSKNLLNTDDFGNTIAHLAARNNAVTVLKEIDAVDSSVLTKENNLKTTPIYESCVFGCPQAFDYLKDKDVDSFKVDWFSESDRNLLLAAIWAGHLDIVTAIIEFLKKVPKQPGLPSVKEYVNAQSRRGGKTALYYTIEVMEAWKPLEDQEDHKSVQEDESMLRIVKLLFANGANPNLQANDEKAPIHLAVKYGLEKTVSELISSGAIMEIKGGSHRTPPLHYAALHNFPDVVELLLKKGANLFSTIETTGQTVLQVATTETIKNKLKECAK